MQVAEKVRRLEEEAMGEKDWFMKGEVPAGELPLLFHERGGGRGAGGRGRAARMRGQAIVALLAVLLLPHTWFLPALAR